MGDIEITMYSIWGKEGSKNQEKIPTSFMDGPLTKRAINQSHFRQKGNHIGVRRGIEQKNDGLYNAGGQTLVEVASHLFFSKHRTSSDF